MERAVPVSTGGAPAFGTYRRWDFWPDPPASVSTGLTGWEVVLRFARPAPRRRAVTPNPNSTEPVSGIPGRTGVGLPRRLHRRGPLPRSERGNGPRSVIPAS